MRVVALIATYNERRFIEPCLRHLGEQGIDAYLIDNCSTDDTVAIAEHRLGRGLIGIESFPRGEGDIYDWRSLLTRKEELARELDADWFIHLDPDEIRLPPSSTQTLVQAIEAADSEGFNAVNFVEFTFVPTRDDPAEVESGWHGWRPRLSAADIRLPRRSQLHVAQPDAQLDPSRPRVRHLLADLVAT